MSQSWGPMHEIENLQFTRGAERRQRKRTLNHDLTIWEEKKEREWYREFGSGNDPQNAAQRCLGIPSITGWMSLYP